MNRYVNATSCAVIGSPSDHVTPLRMWKVQVSPSFEMPPLSAEGTSSASPGAGASVFWSKLSSMS